MGTPSLSALHYREQALQCLGQLPPFSPILNRLLASLGSEDVSFSELAGLIEKDTVLAGHVLRLVNSALYGYRGAINSVRHAVSLIGLVKLRNTALSLSIARMWTKARTTRNWSSARFNQHSVATGILADLLAQRLPVDYAEGAFTAGLLHDVGKLLIAVSLHSEHDEIFELQHSQALTSEDAERQVIGFGHAELSAAILGRWNLPAPIQDATLYHHDPERRTDGLRSLSEIVCFADAIANGLGIGVRTAPATAGAPEATLAELGLEEQAPAIVEEFQTEFNSIREFF